MIRPYENFDLIHCACFFMKSKSIPGGGLVLKLIKIKGTPLNYLNGWLMKQNRLLLVCMTLFDLGFGLVIFKCY